jgi:hypothetical protein
MFYLKSLFAVVVIFAMVTTVGAYADTQKPNQSPAVAPAPELCDGHTHRHLAKTHWSWVNKLVRGYSVPNWARKKHAHNILCAAGPNHRKAMRNQWRKVKKSILPRNHDLWVRIGRCEQPGSGYKGIRWSHTGPTYQGGLGFWYGTWSGYKYPNMPSNAGYASWRQQMKVANRLLAMYGTSPWGCA